MGRGVRRRAGRAGRVERTGWVKRASGEGGLGEGRGG